MPGQSHFLAPCRSSTSAGKTTANGRLARLSLGRGHRGCVVVTGCFLLISCVGSTSRTREPLALVSRPRAPPSTITAVRTIVTPDSAVGIDELVARGRAHFAARRFDDAARDFDRIVELDPDGPFAKEAWFDAAAAHDELGDLEGATIRYLEVARRYPNDSYAREAIVRAVRLLTYLERWNEAGRAADLLLTRAAELPALQRIVAYGGKALSLVYSGNPDEADYFLNKGRDIVDSEKLDLAGALPRDLAGLYFALGELRRIRGEKIVFVPVPPDFPAVLESRCQLLLDAQSAYSDAMRAYDAHWSAMAGYRVGELYQKLHEDLMRIPPPAPATTDAKVDLFRGAMRLRYSVLLRKGLAMMEHTLSLAERTGERSEWVDKARDSKSALERGIREEESALDKLPYSRAELEQALEEVGRRAARKGR